MRESGEAGLRDMCAERKKERERERGSEKIAALRLEGSQHKAGL